MDIVFFTEVTVYDSVFVDTAILLVRKFGSQLSVYGVTYTPITFIRTLFNCTMQLDYQMYHFSFQQCTFSSGLFITANQERPL